jgi:transposase
VGEAVAILGLVAVGISRSPEEYPLELRERAVRLGRPIRHVARDLGIHHKASRVWVRQTQADIGRRRDLPTSGEREELKRLQKENAQLRRRMRS